MSNLTGACVEITVDDKTYSLEPLRFEDMEWLELKLRSRCIEAARLSCEGADSATLKLILDQAFEHASKIDIFKSITDFFNPIGMSMIIWRMARRNHPELTVEQTCEWVKDIDVMSQINPQLTLLVGVKKNQTSEQKTEPVRTY